MATLEPGGGVLSAPSVRANRQVRLPQGPGPGPRSVHTTARRWSDEAPSMIRTPKPRTGLSLVMNNTLDPGICLLPGRIYFPNSVMDMSFYLRALQTAYRAVHSVPPQRVIAVKENILQIKYIVKLVSIASFWYVL